MTLLEQVRVVNAADAAYRNTLMALAIHLVERLLHDDSAKHLDSGYDSGLEDAIAAIHTGMSA